MQARLATRPRGPVRQPRPRPAPGPLHGVFDPLTAHNFLVDAGAAGLFAVCTALTAPFILVLAVRRGAVPWEVGVLTAAPYIALLLSGWYGRLAEGLPQVRLVASTTGLARLLLLVTAWAHGIAAYMLSYLGFNLISAVSNPAYTAIEGAVYREQWRGRLMSGVKFVLGFCQFGATLAAGRLMARLGPGPVFTLASGFGVASSVLFTRMRPPVDPAPLPPAPRIGRTGAPRRDGRFNRLLLALSFAGGGTMLVAPGYPLYQVHRLHLTDVHVAWLTAAWSLAWMVCYPLWGRLCDRRRPRAAIAIAFACYLLPPALYAAGAGLAGVLTAAWFQGMGDAALDCGWQNHTMRLAGRRIGAYAGTYFTFMGLRGTLGPLLGALVVARFGLHPLFGCGLLLVAVGLVLALRLPDAPPAAAAPLPA